MPSSEHEPSRFAFGENWKAFLGSLDEPRIEQAQRSLKERLGCASLSGQRFLDLGSGSGLFSLAAHRLGAEVVSIDYDEGCVACTRELKKRFGKSESQWVCHQGSALDREWIESFGTFDAVYSWGVLHHTGNMSEAIAIAADRTKHHGQYFIAIYNDQGGASRRWLGIKRTYHRLPSWGRPAFVAGVAGMYESKFALARLLQGQNPLPFQDWKAKRRDRGMSVWHDWVDWVGGLPFEVATPERIIVPLKQRGFVLENLKTVGNGWGCNEYVFRRVD
ncbi:bifunctional 3-demethylubiquinone-9 3-methyltransferase/ 2-octaprenyl-6-hydroxy phenol methylase [Novipirellula artificiosorum]|uniref:Bifunctional 3-demethylubiquinone-9 3-methyltransferase/ 2-octaprenyl-6-hydroxy phenol methylase n=1 Tax=Novipirellula artificiosorum TaxID=2528016 RepID=A0A5C6DXY8_9BACT|nr:bifunctional 3-demethylubiquinone-9 3-methyltransferase/ 2-octaprenyl-6-hydroxy phenol methylase [Novipirellula artificiosorum]